MAKTKRKQFFFQDFEGQTVMLELDNGDRIRGDFRNAVRKGVFVTGDKNELWFAPFERIRVIIGQVPEPLRAQQAESTDEHGEFPNSAVEETTE